VWLFAYVQYAGFNVFNTILAGEAGKQTIHLAVKPGIAIATVAAVIVALIGYDFIHRVEQGLTYAFLLIFGVFTIGAIVTLGLPSGQLSLSNFDLTPFLTQFGVTAGYQISWAIYVSDYSRYLPPDVTVRKTFLWTYWGSALGGFWLMALGALLAASAGKNFDTVKSIYDTGNGIFDGFGTIVLLFAALGLISVTALNLYGGSLTLISAVDSFKKVRPTLLVRVVMIGFTGALSLVVAFAASANFLDNFNSFLLLILYLFVPWTAVNLIDYYIVRRGHYAVAEIFKPDGIYGRWAWRGIAAYLIGLAAMVPFFSTPKFTGWVAKAMDKADLSLFIGLPVAGGLYWWFARTIDVRAEARLAEREIEELERAAAAHAAI
jgi:nucleobase:cation symporter-1, NCS1 family